jgi:hypothetical protein
VICVLFETLSWYSVGVLSAPAAPSTVEEFKARTRDKLSGVFCPLHHQTPRLKFEGQTLRDIRVSLSACCDRLAQLANKAIAS